MLNQVMMMLTNQLKIKNPQLFNQYEMLRKNNGNPTELFKQVTNGYSPEQMNNLFNQAKTMGIPEDVINQFQSGINTK